MTFARAHPLNLPLTLVAQRDLNSLEAFPSASHPEIALYAREGGDEARHWPGKWCYKIVVTPLSLLICNFHVAPAFRCSRVLPCSLVGVPESC